MFGLTLAMVVMSQVAPLEGDASAERALPRVKAAVGLLGGVVGIPPLVVPMLGVHCELGAMFDDRLSLSARLSGLAIFGALEFGLVLGGDYVFAERFGVGGGVGSKILLLFDFPTHLTLTVPVRLTYAFSQREPAQIGRRGFVLGAELAAGVLVAGLGGGRATGSLSVPAPAFSAMLTISYVWW